MATFDALVAEASAAPTEGWDFSWLDGRATEQRPSWGYQRLMATRLAGVSSALDLQTGGGEVLAGAAVLPPRMLATESWRPNAVRAARLLNPRRVLVVQDSGEPPLPFVDSAFELITSRHPVSVWWPEIARVLAPGGTYLSQQVGPESVFELMEFFLGPLPQQAHLQRRPEDAAAAATAAGLDVIDLRSERLRMEFFDVGAVVYVLRKVVWWVPDFDVVTYRSRLLAMHRLITADGSFVAHSTRFLLEARKP